MLGVWGEGIMQPRNVVPPHVRSRVEHVARQHVVQLAVRPVGQSCWQRECGVIASSSGSSAAPNSRRARGVQGCPCRTATSAATSNGVRRCALVRRNSPLPLFSCVMRRTRLLLLLLLLLLLWLTRPRRKRCVLLVLPWLTVYVQRAVARWRAPDIRVVFIVVVAERRRHSRGSLTDRIVGVVAERRRPSRGSLGLTWCAHNLCPTGTGRTTPPLCIRRK